MAASSSSFFLGTGGSIDRIVAAIKNGPSDTFASLFANLNPDQKLRLLNYRDETGKNILHLAVLNPRNPLKMLQTLIAKHKKADLLFLSQEPDNENQTPILVNHAAIAAADDDAEDTLYDDRSEIEEILLPYSSTPPQDKFIPWEESPPADEFFLATFASEIKRTPALRQNLLDGAQLAREGRAAIQHSSTRAHFDKISVKEKKAALAAVAKVEKAYQSKAVWSLDNGEDLSFLKKRMEEEKAGNCIEFAIHGKATYTGKTPAAGPAAQKIYKLELLRDDGSMNACPDHAIYILGATCPEEITAATDPDPAAVVVDGFSGLAYPLTLLPRYLVDITSLSGDKIPEEPILFRNVTLQNVKLVSVKGSDLIEDIPCERSTHPKLELSALERSRLVNLFLAETQPYKNSFELHLLTQHASPASERKEIATIEMEPEQVDEQDDGPMP